MSSDNYFDDDFDDAALAQLDEIEAAALATAPARPPPRALAADSSIDISFDIDESELQKIDEHVSQQYNKKVLQMSGPSRTFNRSNSGNMLQTTLFGDVLPSQASTSKPKSTGMQRTKSTPRNVFGQQAPKSKTWDHTAFAQSGMKPTKSKGKGKGKATEKEEDDEEFEPPLPFIPEFCIDFRPPPPMKLKPDLLEAKHWIFPINRSKRDYQFNIVKNCLFENTLVALPTGLGKTFVAGVLMLNYYRWYPEGKIVFVAPTKPLVGQQITASHETCGIPGSDGIELTGQVQSATRSRYWQEKRVFYMTPQTLEHDLLSGICDPMNVILLVIDEAHHATGEYAYNKVVRFMMAKNPHFRLLALTATPGNTAESVQALIDGLHISRIEIRNENSLDLKPYIFEKVVKSHIIKPAGDVFILQDLFLKTMDPIFKPLKNAGLFYPSEHPLTLHPFRPMRIGAEKKHPLAAKSFSQLRNLSALARGVLYLLTGSISSSRDYMEDIREKDKETIASGKQTKGLLLNDPNFQNLMKKFDELKVTGSTPHSKMEKLKDILITYFGARIQEPSEDEKTEKDDTRVMVFSSYRAVVDEIIKELDQHRPLIRAAAFIGQGSDKRGRKGLKQREQIQLIERFQEGEFNVLVATSIGEEGLDIGEIDLTICYDTDKAPTRMIQRFGRTGRKRAGEVHVLLAEAREEFNLDKAKGTYKEVQKVIDRGEIYELYGDVPRLLPASIKPECIEKVMEMQPFVREDMRKIRASAAGKGAKRKRNTDVDRYIPPDMPTTFTSANTIWKQFKKRKVDDLPEDTRELEDLGEDDELDKVIESGILAPARRTQSDKPPAKKRASPKLRRAKTIAGTKKPTAKEKKLAKDAMLTDLARQGEGAELEIESGLLGYLKPSKKSTNAPSSSKRKPSPIPTFENWDLPDTDEEEAVAGTDGEDGVISPRRSEEKSGGENMGWLVDDDEDMLDDFQLGRASPENYDPPQFEHFRFDDDSIEITQAVPSRSKGKRKAVFNDNHGSSSDIEVIDTGPAFPQVASFKPASRITSTDSQTLKSRTLQEHLRKTDMLPPPLPSKNTTASPIQGELAPTFPVKQPKRRRVVTVTSSDEEEPPPMSQTRLRKQVESTPVRPKKPRSSKRGKLSLLDKESAKIFDGEAAHSGDEVSEGYSEEEEERSSDREFLRDSPNLTQISPSYEQTQMYRQSLFTQAPIGNRAPAFRNGPVRPRPFGRVVPSNPRRAWLPSSSPPPEEGLDDYEFGSFIVPDEGDISLEINSDDVILDI